MIFLYGIWDGKNYLAKLNQIVIRILIIFFLFFGISCKKDPSVFSIDNLNNGEIGCFGHAGMGFYSPYPVNSWPGFESCLARGADGSEMDIHMTKDSVLVITHSSNLQEMTSCNGLIKELNWADMNDCKIESRFFKQSKLLSLDEFIEKISNPKDYIFTWDIKFSDFNQEYYAVYARAIVNTINKYDLSGHVFIENPFADFLQHIKDRKNDVNLFLLSDNFEEGLVQLKQRGFYGLSMDTKHITSDQIRKAHNQNVHVTLYGVLSDKDNYAAIEKCPDFIQTDNINYLLKVFGKYNKHNGFINSITK
ncbi:MAG: glycerophosphodiester phosphodiesterase family protein [Bacteroidota bacterium]